MSDAFDYVIVGGGTAGCILAFRLSEAGRSVCVLEAGPPDSNPFIRIPAGFVKTLFDERITWQYHSDPSPNFADRRVPYTQGKTLGGSSSVNGMVYNRGQNHDFDDWAALGNPGWSYADVLPYFRKTECRIGKGDDAYRGRDGRLTVTTSSWPNEIVDAFVQSAQNIGHPFNQDYNGAVQEGVGFYQSAIRKGRRVSTASAFLRPAVKRNRVDVRTNAQATKILLEQGRAAGVAYSSGGDNRNVRAKLGVIVCAGVINSPKLLQLSGVGPAALLQERGVDVLVERQGVGENLRDHYSPRFVARARKGVDSLNLHVTGLPLAMQVAKWLCGRPSVLALSPALVHVFGKSAHTLNRPDYSLVFTPGSYKQGFVGRLDDFPGLTCGAWQMRPESKGYVRIATKNPLDAPNINPNYLAEEEDRRVLIAGLKMARSIFNTKPLADLIESELFPGAEVQSDDELLDFARRFGNSSYHLIGSCRMGQADDPLAVVDARLKVHGVRNLSIADASVMPRMPSANTYASTMMVAEKAADMILQDEAG